MLESNGSLPDCGYPDSKEQTSLCFAALAATALFAINVVALALHLSVIILLIYNIRRRNDAFRQGFYVLSIAVSLADWLYVVNIVTRLYSTPLRIYIITKKSRIELNCEKVVG